MTTESREQTIERRNEIQQLADESPTEVYVLLAICDIARLSHAGKHGARIKELLGKFAEYQLAALRKENEALKDALDVARNVAGSGGTWI